MVTTLTSSSLISLLVSPFSDGRRCKLKHRLQNSLYRSMMIRVINWLRARIKMSGNMF